MYAADPDNPLAGETAADDRPGSPVWYMTFMHPDAVAWRRWQAEVDADIPSLARDLDADALERRMDSEGVPIEEQRE